MPGISFQIDPLFIQPVKPRCRRFELGVPKSAAPTPPKIIPCGYPIVARRAPGVGPKHKTPLWGHSVAAARSFGRRRPSGANPLLSGLPGAVFFVWLRSGGEGQFPCSVVASGAYPGQLRRPQLAHLFRRSHPTPPWCRDGCLGRSHSATVATAHPAIACPCAGSASARAAVRSR